MSFKKGSIHLNTQEKKWRNKHKLFTVSPLGNGWEERKKILLLFRQSGGIMNNFFILIFKMFSQT